MRRLSFCLTALRFHRRRLRKRLLARPAARQLHAAAAARRHRVSSRCMRRRRCRPVSERSLQPDRREAGRAVKITSPLAGALDTLDGFSTTAVDQRAVQRPGRSRDARAVQSARAPTGTESVFVLDATHGAPLVPGVDYTVRVSDAAGNGDGIVEIVPLKPLAPRTRYAFIMTDRVHSTTGAAAGADTCVRRRARRASGRAHERARHAAARSAVSRRSRRSSTTATDVARHAGPERRRGLEHAARSRSATCSNGIEASATPRNALLVVRRHHHGAARRRPARHRRHLYGLHRDSVLRRPRQSAHELLGQRALAAAGPARPHAGCRASPTCESRCSRRCRTPPAARPSPPAAGRS